ncbi:atypical chemokine receptor 3-like [Lethenteron reissneri]|uniref:atypical chemokine receptor 3-like n=1 Tax=Lethenteron reissneri TaxID=7753 RepID=UPI002AB5F30D|nr:atypical chemokine receptor 3-like [Lethenteron reissneri]
MSSIDFTSLLESLEEFNSSELPEEWTRLCNASDLECLWREVFHCVHPFDKSSLFVPIALLNCFVFFAGLLGNAAVLWLLWRPGRGGRPEVRCYVLNLAVADLFVVLTLPVWTVSLLGHGAWSLGDFMCKCTHFVYSVNLYGSIFFLVALSADRYVTLVLSPDLLGRLAERRARSRAIACAGVWLLALAVSMPDIVYIESGTAPHTNQTYCVAAYPLGAFSQWMAGMQLMCNAVGFALPFPIIAVCYALVARALRDSGRAGSPREARSARRLLVAYVVVFVLCWLPYHAALFVDALALLEVVELSCGAERFLYSALHVTQCFALVHCCANPALYSLLSRGARGALRRALVVRFSKGERLQEEADAATGDTDCTEIRPSERAIGD